MIPTFQTKQTGVGGAEAAERAARWFKVTDKIDSGLSGLAEGKHIVRAVPWNGSQEGKPPTIVQANNDLEVGDKFYAVKPEGGTGVTYNSNEIIWTELGGKGAEMPTGGTIYQVWSVLDADGNHGWEFVKFS